MQAESTARTTSPAAPRTRHRTSGSTGASDGDGGRAPRLTRRAALARLGALACVAVAGCTPLRVLARWYPDEFDEDAGLVDRVLRAFVDAVIPGAPPDDPDLARVFGDPGLPFSAHAAYFAADLCRRAESRHGVRFDALPRSGRVAVVREGLGADVTTRRLYDGAIFLAQVSCYAGIYDDGRGCPLIGFEGRYRPRPLSELTFPDATRFLAPAATGGGNAA